MLNSQAAGRRLALRILRVQLAVIAALALASLVAGEPHALGVALGGLAVAAGGWLTAWRTFSGSIAAGPTLMRLVGGVALKWLVIVLVLYIALAQLALPPPAVIGGVLAALAVNWLALVFKS